MSMFDDTEFQLRGSRNIISGATTDFGENASAAYTATLFSFRTDQFRQAVTEAYDEEIERVFAVTGKKLPNPFRDRIGPIGESLAKGQVELLDAEDRREFWREFGRGEGSAVFNLVEQNFATKVAEFGLDAKLPSDYRARALELQRETVARNEEIANRAGFFGSIGQFTGAAGASLTDPPVFLSMLIGAPWATTVGRAFLIEAGIAGLVETAIQPTIQAQRARAGLPSGVSQAIQAITFTALGAGIFAGGLRGLVRGSRKLVDAVRSVGNLPREVRQAMNVLDRINDIQETSPFHPFSRADGEHAARFSRAQELLIEDAVGPRIREEAISVVRADVKRNRLTAKELELSGREAEAFAIAQTIRARLIEEAGGDLALDEAREIARALGDNELFVEVLAALRNPVARPRPQSLLNFLTEEGGLIDVGGELAAIGVTANLRPSLTRGRVQPLLRKTGRKVIGAAGRKAEDAGGLQPMRRPGEPMTLDEATELASEAGFFPMSGDRVSINELLEAMDQEVRGSPLFRQDDADELALFDADAENLDFIQRRLDNLGIDINRLDDLQVRAIIDDLAAAPLTEPRASPGELRAMSESRGLTEAIDEGAKNADVLDTALEAEVRDIYAAPGERRVTMEEGEVSAKEVFDDLEEWDKMLAEWRDCIARVEV